MLDPTNDIRASKNISFSLADAVASRFLDDYHSQQPEPERTQDAASATAGSSDATRPTPGSSDAAIFVPPIPGSSDAATPSTSGKKPFVPPIPGTSDPDGWQLSRGSGKPEDYLDVDASSLFIKKPTSEKSRQARVGEIRKLMQNDPELKQAYSDKLQALQNGSKKSSDADSPKQKERAKKILGSDKKVPGFNDKLDLQDIPAEQEKQGRVSQKLTDAEIAKMKATANKFPPSEKIAPASTDKLDMQDVPKQKEIDKNLERNIIKKDKVVSGQDDDSTIQPKPLKKLAPVKDTQEPTQQVNGEDEAIREFEMSLRPSGKKTATVNEDDSTIQPKPLKKPAPIKEAQEPSITNGEDEALREFEMSRTPSSTRDSTPDEESDDIESTDEETAEESEFMISFDTSEGQAADDKPAGGRVNFNANDLGPKAENLTAVRNEQKDFVARTSDGSNVLVRRDGTCTLSSAEGRTKVSPDGVVTVTENGIEQQFHFDNASRIKEHLDGSKTYYFREGTSVTELRQGGEPSGLEIKQPKGTTIRTRYDFPSELQYSRATVNR